MSGAACNRIFKTEKMEIHVDLLSPDFLKYTTFFDENSVLRYKAGEFIFHRGDQGKSMYVVLEGKVRIVIGKKTLSVIHEGDIFGDMALIDNAARSANARALTDCAVVAIDAYAFRFLVEKHPEFALDMLRVMANRIRVMNFT
jgi:CRP/FNR family transcriptional regulator, cyclic AMP receptor protein